MVTLEMVRTQIADRPQIWPPAASDPEIIGFGDGVQTIFSLTFENFIAGTLTIFQAGAAAPGAPATYTAVPGNMYTVGAASSSSGSATAATNQVVTFSSAPDAGTIMAARYQATAFSDADLQTYLNNAILDVWPDDRTTLKAITFDLIDVILMDQRRLEMLAQGDYRKDPSAYQRGLQTLKESLRKDLAGGPLPGTVVPAIAVANNAAFRYAPWR